MYIDDDDNVLVFRESKMDSIWKLAEEEKKINFQFLWANIK